MEQEFMTGFVAELEKIGYIFGKEEPQHPFTTSRNVPYRERTGDYLTYAKAKAKEDPTAWWKALLGGGAVGGGTGALLGLSAKRKGLGAAIGAGIGTGLGALIGAGMRQADVSEIAHTERMVKDRPAAGRYVRARIAGEEDWQRESDRESRIEAGRETGKAIGEGIRDGMGGSRIRGIAAKKAKK